MPPSLPSPSPAASCPRHPSFPFAWRRAFSSSRFLVSTFSQIRELADLTPSNPPGRVAITIPGCSEGEELLCPLSKLRALTIRSVDADCITPPEVQQYARN